MGIRIARKKHALNGGEPATGENLPVDRFDARRECLHISVFHKKTSIQLPDAQVTALDERAADRGCSRDEIVEEAVIHYLADRGDVARADHHRIRPEDIWGRGTADRVVEAEPW